MKRSQYVEFLANHLVALEKLRAEREKERIHTYDFDKVYDRMNDRFQRQLDALEQEVIPESVSTTILTPDEAAILAKRSA